MGDYGTIWMKYPFSNTWRDVTNLLHISSFEIEERVNTAGICTMQIENADEWAENTVLPGFQFRVFLNDYDKPFDRPDFEGYIPPDFNPHLLGTEKSMELPVVGYYDKYSRILYDDVSLKGWNAVSAMFHLNSKVVKPDGNTWMDFQGEMDPVEVVRDDVKKGTNLKVIMKKIREGLVDDEDTFYPRYYHLITIPQADSSLTPLFSLKKEPLLSSSAEISIDWSDVLTPIQIDTNETFLSTTFIGDKDGGWEKKYSNENLKYMQMDLQKDIRSKKDDGLLSSQSKGYELYGVKDMGKSITLKIRRRHQIPLLSSITLTNCPEVELAGNMIVYGKRTLRGQSHVTELVLKSLPEEILLPA